MGAGTRVGALVVTWEAIDRGCVSEREIRSRSSVEGIEFAESMGLIQRIGGLAIATDSGREYVAVAEAVLIGDKPASALDRWAS